MTAPASIFDDVAPAYDDQFSHTPLGLALRRRVWALLERLVVPGDRLLDFACGTGEDALWLAGRGVHVVAADASPAMLRQAETKFSQAGLGERAATQRLTWDDLLDGRSPAWEPFDAILSNFGGINATPRWEEAADALAARLRPGGHLVLVPMGPLCPWEIGWHLIHGHPGAATRRLRQPATAKIGRSAMAVWYPSPKRLRVALSPRFVTRRVESLGFWLPPSYLSHLVDHRPRLLRQLSRLDAGFARLCGGLGDHFVLVAERRR